MHRLVISAVLILSVASTAACGKSDEEKAAEQAAEETRQAAEAVRRAAESVGSAAGTDGMQQAAKALEGLAGIIGGATPDGKPVNPVSFKELQTALPELAGWERQKPTGERMTVPVPFSQAEVNYVKGDSNITVKIVDSAFSQMLMAPWSMFLTAGYEKELSDGYEKSVNVAGNPGFERWNDENKDGELNLIMAKRFLVTLEGNNLADTKVLHEVASKITANQLAALK